MKRLIHNHARTYKNHPRSPTIWRYHISELSKHISTLIFHHSNISFRDGWSFWSVWLGSRDIVHFHKRLWNMPISSMKNFLMQFSWCLDSILNACHLGQSGLPKVQSGLVCTPKLHMALTFNRGGVMGSIKNRWKAFRSLHCA